MQNHRYIVGVGQLGRARWRCAAFAHKIQGAIGLRHRTNDEHGGRCGGVRQRHCAWQGNQRLGLNVVVVEGELILLIFGIEWRSSAAAGRRQKRQNNLWPVAHSDRNAVAAP